MKLPNFAQAVACALSLSVLLPAASNTAAQESVPAITELRLVQYVAPNKFTPLQTLTDQSDVVLANLPERVNIEAISADTARTGSVKFILEGPKTVNRFENIAIYTLADAYVNFDLTKQGLPAGDYALQVTPFSLANATGDAGATLTTRFTVYETETEAARAKAIAKVPAVTSIQLVEPLGNSRYGNIQTVNDGDVLVHSELPNLLNFEAISSDPASTGSVDFSLQGPKELQRFENVAIYTLADSHYNFDTGANDLPVGDYVLRVTPYSGANRTGDAGQTLTLEFSVQAEPVAEGPSIAAVQILDYGATGEKPVVRQLANGDTLLLSDLPQLINFEAVPATAELVGSVDFVLQGPLDLARFENTAIYTMANSYYNIDTTANGLPEGSYSLTITPYSGTNLTGTAGEQQVVNFTVVSQLGSADKAQPPMNNVPPIAGVQVLEMQADGGYQVVDQLVDGDTLDLGHLPNTINFEAVSTDDSKTGSVTIELDGPRPLSRVENNAIYTIADTARNFNLLEQDLPAGNYTLRLTPYTGTDGTGEAGFSSITRFSVTGKSAPVRVPPSAKDDSYHGTAENALRVPAASGLLSNDIAESLETAEARVIAEPEHGTLTLDSDGAFTYTPDYRFAGQDGFQYLLVDEYGAQSQAMVSLHIAQAEKAEAADAGFTPIVASDDTRTVYVSSSEGLDANDGLSIESPVKTLNKAFSIVRSGFPDHVLLKRGDVWVDENLSKVKSGRSKAEPAVVAFYGERGARPKLKTSSTSLSTNKLHHVHIMGLEIEAYKLNPADRAFDGATSANIRMVGDFENILFEDLKLRFVEFVIQGYRGVARDIHIRRSMILDKYSPNTSYNRDSRPSGIYTDNGNGLTVEDNLWDHNGWNAEVHGAGANMYNHNMYISEKNNVGNNIVVRNNIVTRGSALGIHGRPGGLYENNFFGRNAIGLQMGYKSGPALAAGTIAYARNNVVSEGLNMNRGIDACSGTNLCTKAIWGVQVENLGEGDVRVEGNIVANRLFEHQGHVSGIRHDAAAKYSNNIVYRWDSQTQDTNSSYPDPKRTLADYNASLGGDRSFEAFIEAARNRGLQQWDERYSADAINDYIRAGFGR